MLSYRSRARRESSGTLPATTFRPVASQPLSTDDSQLSNGWPLGGPSSSFSPVRWSYQLKNWPLSCRSMPSSVVIVLRRRLTSSRWEMSRSRSAATALHR
jgi:hypothetical protein